MFLFQKLPNILKLGFPKTKIEGHLIIDYYPSSKLDLSLIQKFYKKKTKVIWDKDTLKKKERFQWIEINQEKGFIPKDIIKINKNAWHNWEKAIDQFDQGLNRLSHHYVRTYSNFDFLSIKQLIQSYQNNNDLQIFHRATILKIVLLYITYILLFLLPKENQSFN
jgi:hypothetical protein